MSRRSRSRSRSRSGGRGRGRSRERSPPRRERSPPRYNRERSPPRYDGVKKEKKSDGDRPSGSHDTEVISLGNDDIAFVLGRGGNTKRKIARVSGANLEVHERDMKLEIYGSEEARGRAREYVELVLAQRVGPVFIDFNQERPDLTVVEVPSDCVGYVTGRRGTVLRQLEEEWGTLMFFAKQKSQGDSRQALEKLAIFGPKRGRRAARLKVLSAVEHKTPGFVLDGDKCRTDLDKDIEEGEDWGNDLIPLAQADFSYALGKMGSTRKKLAWSSGCIVQYIGHVAFFAGTKKERQRGKEYLRWLIKQRTGIVHVDTEGRDDVTVVKVPRECVGFITGYKGASLRQIEKASGSFCFADGEKGRSSSSRDTERLLIFSHSESNRRHARELVEDMVKQKQRDDGRRYGGGGGGGYGRRDDRDRRDDYRRRRRSPSYSRSRSRDRGRRRRYRSRSRSR